MMKYWRYEVLLSLTIKLFLIRVDSNFEGADFTNAVVDRASFKGSSLNGAIFKNAVLSGTSFEGANVENVDFTEAALGDYDIKNLCKNPTLKGTNPTTSNDTRESAGCF
jgi:uncharacterized protein YjbI with pentapeptide repeats